MIDPGVDHVLADARFFSVGLRGSFRGLTSREGILISGPFGWGEFAPFADYSDEQAARWLATALEAAFVGWPKPSRSRVRVNAIVPVRSYEQTTQMVRNAVQRLGCRTIKVKVANPAESGEFEFQRISLIRDVLDEELGPGQGRIRLDANAGWSLGQATDRLERLAELDIEYVEQPCRTPRDMASVKRADIVPVAADESIRIDGLVAGVSDLADVAVIKAAPVGGVRAGLDLADRLGLPIVVSSAMDTSVGLSAGIALAGALPTEPLDCGFATGTLLAQDLTATTTLPVAGQVDVVRANPDSSQMASAQAQMSAERKEEWATRLRHAWPHLSPELTEQVHAQ